jgi:alkylation response protein AidB-like acyl-CoA dehydrogenase
MSVAFVLEKFGTEEQKNTYLPLLASMDGNSLEEGATFLTEIQGGSDVGATQTRAVKNGDHYFLTGEKWFCSNCDAGVIIILARTGEVPGTKGLSLFLMPRYLSNGEKNRIAIRRLKDKLGVRAVASGECILDRAVGYLIGKEEEGFKIMAEALNISRMCTTTGSLGISRRAFLEAATYASKREAFSESLTEYPMVRETLLSMITEIEAVWALTSRMLLTFDQIHTDHEKTEDGEVLLRFLLTLAKYRASENGVKHAREALELHGGNGYIEEYVTPRLLRDAQINTVWEGTSNIMALELMKLLHREAKRKKGADCVLFDQLYETLTKVHLLSLSPLVLLLTEERRKLIEEIAILLQKPLKFQNVYARKMLDKVVDLACSVFLLEEAQYLKVEKNEDRLLKLAEYYIMRTYRPQYYSVESGNIPSIDLFEEAVLFRGVVKKGAEKAREFV